MVCYEIARECAFLKSEGSLLRSQDKLMSIQQRYLMEKIEEFSMANLKVFLVVIISPTTKLTISLCNNALINLPILHF